MTIAEVNTPYQTRQVITFANDGNKVIKPYRSIKQIYKNLYVDLASEYGIVTLFACYDDRNGIRIKAISDDMELDEIIRQADNSNIDTFDSYIEGIKNRINSLTWINLAELEYLRLYAPELMTGAEKARTAWRAKQDERRRQEEAERTAREQAEHDAENAKSFEKINKAIEVFKATGRINNDNITVWTGFDDYKDYTVITYLLDEYKVKCPIKTRGSIINSICAVMVNPNNTISYSKYNKTISEKAFEVLEELRDKIRYGIDVNKTVEAITENILSFEGYKA